MTAAAPASASSIFDCRVAVAAPFLRPHRRRPLLCRRGPPGAPADGQPPRARRVAPPVSGRDVAGGRARRADPAPPPPRRRTPAGGAAVAATSGSWASLRRRLGAGRHSAEGGRYGVPALPMPRTRHSAARATRRAGGAGAVSTRPRPVRGSCRRRHRGRPPVACVVLSCRWRAGVPTVGSLPPPPGGLASAGVAPPRPTPPDAAAVGNAVVAVAVAALLAGTRGGPRVAVAATRQLRARATAGRVWGRRGRRWANRPRWVDRCPPT